MKLLFELEDGDIIVMPAKQSGAYDSQCKLIRQSFTTPAVDLYLRTNFSVNNIDYAAANRSLDLTIDALGRRRVEEDVRRHRMLTEVVQVRCASEAVFPCSANGTLQQAKSRLICYYNDWGCAYQCVDQFMQEYKMSNNAIRW